MLTAESITDEQIRRLKRMTLGKPNKTDDDHEIIRVCGIALTDRRAMAFLMPGVHEGVERCRARCAEILNARAKEAKQP